MFDAAPFDDGRGRYPDKLTTAVPRGFRAALRRVAERERVGVSELVRRELGRLVAAAGQNGTSSHA